MNYVTSAQLFNSLRKVIPNLPEKVTHCTIEMATDKPAVIVVQFLAEYKEADPVPPTRYLLIDYDDPYDRQSVSSL